MSYACIFEGVVGAREQDNERTVLPNLVIITGDIIVYLVIEYTALTKKARDLIYQTY